MVQPLLSRPRPKEERLHFSPAGFFFFSFFGKLADAERILLIPPWKGKKGEGGSVEEGGVNKKPLPLMEGERKQFGSRDFDNILVEKGARKPVQIYNVLQCYKTSLQIFNACFPALR